MISVVICTYNRPNKVVELVGMLQKQTLQPHQIVVVDSSDEHNEQLNSNNAVDYIRSSHKNQPYQRYIGYLASTSDYLLYLDDDMEPYNSNVIDALLKKSNSNKPVEGIAINFKDKYDDSSLSRVPVTVLPKKGRIISILRGMSGYKRIPDGQLGYCGLRGKQPEHGGYTSWVSGGAFIAKKSHLFKNFNFQLFDLFEQRLGMGEDAIIGYTLSKQGKVLYLPECMFWHNDTQDSGYSLDLYTYSKRVAYSRLFLTLEKARLDGSALMGAYLFYHWYMIWRCVGSFINMVMNPISVRRRKIFNGMVVGWILSLGFTFDKVLSRSTYWINEAEIDMVMNRKMNQTFV